ncbi:hypothetical protein AYL99_07695 [Fonsecaea erecta]|uniref:YDG domain-containing protein n=1 Tax=Fonsecaea erecta TaxID=1367422 RepID=A0A178ZHW6_9EURO|nr:hypothetical protein AYL99_07695 [Fonsecaea erecta]OAP58605.1 hypothetical protein AYL99_07695 [Fonsecaea erecta]
MASPTLRLDSRHLGDDRMTEVPGVGLVPNRPRSSGRFIDRETPQRHSQRHGSSREESHDNQIFKQESPDNAPADENGKNVVRTDSDMSTPKYYSPMQFLAEIFDRRRCELSEEVTRQAALSSNASHDQGDHMNRHRFYARDQLQNQRSNSSARRSSEPIGLKREDSTELQDEVQSDTDDASGTTSRPKKRAKSTSSGTRGGSRRRSSPPPGSGSSSPAPDERARIFQGCRCPVGFDCPKKKDDLVDCRTLVLEREKWIWDQRRKRAEDLPPDLPEEEEPFLTVQETIPIIRLLDQVRTRGRMSMAIRHTFTKIQEWIRLMQNHSMTQQILDESRVLEHLKRFLSDDYMPIRIEKGVPEHIVEDLTYLHRKWEFGDLGVLARRGLRARTLHRPLYPDPDWEWKREANDFGHGHLINGQTWCLRAEMMRDGAHAPPIAGISGTKSKGARSVVMGYHDETKQHFYADVDEGETIYYYGTALPPEGRDTKPTNIKDPVTQRVERVTKNSRGEGPTAATESLFTSYTTGRPVRVFRSFRLAKIVPWRPVTGFRYDGLYIVTAPELVKIERQIYRFKMERMTTGQGPLRHSGAPLRPESRGSQKRRRDGS